MPPPARPNADSSPRLIEQVRERIRYRHYSYRTEQAYVDWVKRFVRFNGLRHPREMGREAIEAFLCHLAVERNVATSTHNQALSALLFLYGQVLGIELPWLGDIERPKRPPRRPVVLTPEEVRRVLAHLDGRNELMARMLYGTGMRLMECVRLRVKDLDLARTRSWFAIRRAVAIALRWSRARFSATSATSSPAPALSGNTIVREARQA